MAFWGMGIVLVLSMGAAVLLMALTSRGLMRQLGGEPDEAENVAQQIASGDLSRHELNRTGLLGSLGDMRAKLRGLVENITHHSTQLSAAAEELSAVTSQSSANVRLLQSEADQVVTAVEEMSATSEEVANNAATVATAARQANEQSHSGREIVDSARSNVDGLAKKVAHASDVINKLNQESAKIGSVVDVISAIAEQTNLLALNAAIEAARAGEQGRGFAVVADEVRSLASRTQQSTKEIQQIVQQLKAGISAAVIAMNEATGNASESMKHMELADGALANIAEAIDNISTMTDQIATAMEEQSATTREIAANMTDIHQATEMTSAGTDQTSAATQELAKLAGELNGMTQRFRLTA
jgi:methyl-accepting chemotaxis protein